jgi:hypothetical protein
MKYQFVAVVIKPLGAHFSTQSINNKLHEDELFLRSRNLCSYSRIFQNFTEPEGVCSQEPSTGPYLELDQSFPYHPIISL